ncbi:hypothetical protein T492DRAFT_980641 [Pavlovales sp. CCMP2436]|nr:hypothetical protein T492DRAFT_980641 [Pavlovales sp. CCMP2436]
MLARPLVTPPSSAPPEQLDVAFFRRTPRGSPRRVRGTNGNTSRRSARITTWTCTGPRPSSWFSRKTRRSAASAAGRSRSSWVRGKSCCRAGARSPWPEVGAPRTREPSPCITRTSTCLSMRRRWRISRPRWRRRGGRPTGVAGYPSSHPALRLAPFVEGDRGG